MIQVWEPNAGGGCEEKYRDSGNNIKVQLKDGAVAQYVHTQSKVTVGQAVAIGQEIGLSAGILSSRRSW